MSKWKGYFPSRCVSTNIKYIFFESACNKHDSLLFIKRSITRCWKAAALILIQQNKNAEAAGTMKEKPTRSIKPRRITLGRGARSPCRLYPLQRE